MIAPILSFLSSYWKIIGIALVIAGAFFAGLRYESALCEKEKQDIIREYTLIIQSEADRRQQLSEQYEEQMSKARAEARVTKEIVRVEIEKPIYKECRVPLTGIDIINNTVKNMNEMRQK